jgi:hypothetical protein
VKPPRQPVWYSLLAVLVTALLTAAASIVISVRLAEQTSRESERKWCAIITILTGGPTPETERGRAVAAAMLQLRRDLGCL